MASGIHPFTAQHIAKRALVKAAREALDGREVDVSFGLRWPMHHKAWVAVTSTDSDIDPSQVGPRRQLDERITITVEIGVWEPGADTEAEERASEDAFGLLETLAEHVRLNDPTLGGTVLWCLPGSSSSDGATSEQDAVEGRLCIVVATFVCTHRIR